MPHIGIPELVVIFLIVFFLFGAKRLPDIAKSVGQALREFKRVGKEDEAPKA